jgi:hypothetical protein
MPSVLSSDHTLRRLRPSTALVIQIPRKKMIRVFRQRTIDILVPNRAIGIDLNVGIRIPSYTSHRTEVLLPTKTIMIRT